MNSFIYWNAISTTSSILRFYTIHPSFYSIKDLFSVKKKHSLNTCIQADNEKSIQVPLMSRLALFSHDCIEILVTVTLVTQLLF